MTSTFSPCRVVVASRCAWVGVVTASLLLAPRVCGAQPQPDAATVSRYANELLDRQGISTQGPGIAVLVVRGDELLVHMTRGLASVETRCAPATDFRIAAAQTLAALRQGAAGYPVVRALCQVVGGG